VHTVGLSNDVIGSVDLPPFKSDSNCQVKTLLFLESAEGIAPTRSAWPLEVEGLGYRGRDL
jgi:hypothetical protein